MTNKRDVEILGLTGGYPLKYTLPILFSIGSKKELLKINNGSITLADFGNGKFFITCYHVLESFLDKLKAKSPNEKPLFQVGNFSLNREPPIIDRNKELDLVTISMTYADHIDMKRNYKAGIGDCFVSSTESSDIKEGDEVVFGGFPGDWKNRVNTDFLRFYSFSASFATVSSVKNNEIVCQLDDLKIGQKYLVQRIV